MQDIMKPHRTFNQSIIFKFQIATVKRGNIEQKKAFFRGFCAITFFLFQIAKN